MVQALDAEVSRVQRLLADTREAKHGAERQLKEAQSKLKALTLEVLLLYHPFNPPFSS